MAVLQLCREFGFTIAIDPSDPKLLRVSKTLHHVIWALRPGGSGLAGSAGQAFIRSLAAIPQPRQEAPVEIEGTSLLDAFGRLLGGDTMEA